MDHCYIKCVCFWLETSTIFLSWQTGFTWKVHWYNM